MHVVNDVSLMFNSVIVAADVDEAVLWSLLTLIIIIIIHKFHGDTSLKQNFRAAVNVTCKVVSMLPLPLVCVVVLSAKQFRL